MQNERENERKRHTAFLAQHQAFYDELVGLLANCIERSDVAELALHVAYVGKILEMSLNYQMMIQKRSGNA